MKAFGNWGRRSGDGFVNSCQTWLLSRSKFLILKSLKVISSSSLSSVFTLTLFFMECHSPSPLGVCGIGTGYMYAEHWRS